MRIIISENFLRGYKRVLNMSGTKEWPDISGDRTKDFDALRRDWNHVGESIRRETTQIRRGLGSRA